jgi:peroxiredoxin
MIVLAARLLLAAVFAVAGVGKLLRAGETEATLGKFGLSEGLRRPVAIALPLAELAIAATLLPATSAPWAAVAAFLLLATFTIAVARVLRGEEEVDCNCFGSLAPSRVSGRTLARNLGLMVLAALVAIAGWSDSGPSAVAWVGDLDAVAAVAILAGLAMLAAALNFAFSWQLMKQNGRLVAELARVAPSGDPRVSAGTTGLPLGRMAPEFELPALDGGITSLEDLLVPGQGLILFFSDPGCTACDPLLPEVAHLQADPEADPRPVALSPGDREAVRRKAKEHGLDPVLVLEDFELPRSLGIGGVPGAIMLDHNGRVASEAAVGAAAVGELLANASAPLRLIKVEAG